MTKTVELPDELEDALENKAKQQQQSVNELVVDILTEVLAQEQNNATLESLVAEIKAQPANSPMFQPAQGSLAEVLRKQPHDPAFDLEKWRREWAEAAAEMEAIERLDQEADRKRQAA